MYIIRLLSKTIVVELQIVPIDALAKCVYARLLLP